MRWWDIDGAVLALERTLFEGDSWSAELFWSELAAADSRHYIVAELPTGLVGYAGLSVQGTEAYVQTMAVAAAYEGRGVGSRLLAALLTEASARGALTAGLEVRADNARAQRLYARFGFEAVAIRRGYYQPSNADAIVMIADRIGTPGYCEWLAQRLSTHP